ncbi:MAG: HAD family hydrolase [Firmicutes bacterium]|nr:HAD family hydrolase [Bacillota bacterium]
MIEAILLDLDGTLLNVDMDSFLERYLKKLAQHLAAFTDPASFSKNLWASTGAMVRNTDPQKTNKDAFIEHFCTWMDHSQEQVWPCIDEFYENVFPTLQEDIGPFPGVPYVMEKLRQSGCRLVLATNPIFPLSAILHRMKWAGLNPEDFALITSYEKMHYCKPNPMYYLEIARMINVAPEKCLMVGNEYLFDIEPAEKAGMHTFLVDETLGALDNENKRGRLLDLLTFLSSLTAQKTREEKK